MDGGGGGAGLEPGAGQRWGIWVEGGGCGEEEAVAGAVAAAVEEARGLREFGVGERGHAGRHGWGFGFCSCSGLEIFLPSSSLSEV